MNFVEVCPILCVRGVGVRVSVGNGRTSQCFGCSCFHPSCGSHPNTTARTNYSRTIPTIFLCGLGQSERFSSFVLHCLTEPMYAGSLRHVVNSRNPKRRQCVNFVPMRMISKKAFFSHKCCALGRITRPSHSTLVPRRIVRVYSTKLNLQRFL